jgi:hypothetical protein
MNDDGQIVGDVENPTLPTPPSAPVPAATDNPRRNWKKVLFYSTFLIAVIALSVSLGVILPKNNDLAVSNNPSSSEGSVYSNDVVTLTGPTEESATTTEATDPPATDLGESTSTSSDPAIPDSTTSGSTTAAAAGETITTATTDSSDTSSTSASSPSSDLIMQFIQSSGPLEAKVRMIDASAVNSYNSCGALEEDIINALKHFANKVIENEKTNDW